jgi:DNA repair protein RadC
MKIKDIAKVDRPREILEKYGPEKLSDAQLLAILLRTGTKDCNVVELSKKILKKFPNEKLLSANIEDLSEIHGLGKVKASEIIACLEFGKRILKDKKSSILLSPKDVWERMEDIRGSKKEHFVVFYLDTRNQEIKREIISIGTLNESLVHPREVFEGAIKNNAASIIVAHNHPSGESEPSQDDIDITKKLIHAGKILDIKIIDHVIVTKNKYKCLNNIISEI